VQKIIPNISINECKKALDFYRGVFGGEVKNVQMADGVEMFKGHEGKIIHSELVINDCCILYLTDVFHDSATQQSNITLMLQIDNLDEINKVYSALKQDGSVEYELQKTFWGSYHAVLTDKFGVKWSMDFAVPR